MIEVDANRVEGVRARRRTWLWGGGMLAASALLQVWAASVPGIPVEFLPSLLFAAGTVIFAIGLGRSGSVTARRPLGTGALIALAVWLLIQPLIVQLTLPSDPMSEFTDWGARTQLLAWVQIASIAVSLALALIAVSQIGRAGVVPRPWNWAPLWALGAVAVTRALVMGMLMVPGVVEMPDTAVAVSSLAGFLEVAAVGFLGILAMVLATRPLPGTTTVYGSGS